MTGMITAHAKPRTACLYRARNSRSASVLTSSRERQSSRNDGRSRWCSNRRRGHGGRSLPYRLDAEGAERRGEDLPGIAQGEPQIPETKIHT